MCVGGVLRSKSSKGRPDNGIIQITEEKTKVSSGFVVTVVDILCGVNVETPLSTGGSTGKTSGKSVTILPSHYIVNSLIIQGNQLDRFSLKFGQG